MKNKKTIKTISGKNVEGYTHFLYDGCHKFYLLKSGKLTTDMKDNGYEQSSIYPIDVLPDMFWDSCPLRFIEDEQEKCHIFSVVYELLKKRTVVCQSQLIFVR